MPGLISKKGSNGKHQKTGPLINDDREVKARNAPRTPLMQRSELLDGRSDSFSLFFLSGAGKGRRCPRTRPGGGGSAFIENKARGN